MREGNGYSKRAAVWIDSDRDGPCSFLRVCEALDLDAAEIRFRAERRLGEMIVAQKQTVGLAKGTRGQLAGKNPSGGARIVPPENNPFNGAATLAEAGIDKKLSARLLALFR